MSTGVHTKACCEIPPVEAKYTPKGTYETVGGMKSYVTGPKDAKVAVLGIYDIFGFSPQALQGADLLASQGFRVVMPDIMGDNPVDPSWFGSEEGNKKRAAWFQQYPGKVDEHVEEVRKIIAEMKQSGATKLAAFGACWGYKVVAMSAAGEHDFSAIVGLHPSFPDPSDADKIDCPTLLLCSKDENKEKIDGVHEGLNKKHHGHKHHGKHRVSWYHSRSHGFLGARANLAVEEERNDFHKGYTEAANFIKEHTE